MITQTINTQSLIELLEDPEVRNAIENLVARSLEKALDQRERNERKTSSNLSLHKYFYEKNITYLMAKGGPAEAIIIGSNIIGFAPKNTFMAIHDPRNDAEKNVPITYYASKDVFVHFYSGDGVPKI